jgi:hypothetical protein
MHHPMLRPRMPERTQADAVPARPATTETDRNGRKAFNRRDWSTTRATSPLEKRQHRMMHMCPACY